jgi:hypothetical protein
MPDNETDISLTPILLSEVLPSLRNSSSYGRLTDCV